MGEDGLEGEKSEAVVAVEPSITEMSAVARQEQLGLLETNEKLQRFIRSALDLRRKGQEDGTTEARYMSLRKTLVEQHAKLQATEQYYDGCIMELRDVLQERLQRSTSIASALRHFIVEVGKGAENSRTGKPISHKLVTKLNDLDVTREKELRELRLQHIDLRNRLARLEQTVREKEQLAEGLHLIDFEQLKIENQALNEKIEERNEELLKLKKKITTTVQILTHMREKLQFVMRSNKMLRKEVHALGGDLATKRDALAKVKAHRDKLRVGARSIKEGSLYIDNPMLLEDMKKQAAHKEALMSEIEDLQAKSAEIGQRVAERTHQILALTQEINAGGR